MWLIQHRITKPGNFSFRSSSRSSMAVRQKAALILTTPYPGRRWGEVDSHWHFGSICAQYLYAFLFGLLSSNGSRTYQTSAWVFRVLNRVDPKRLKVAIHQGINH
ncbi:hypothetical protein N7468_007206 [Penicillium chermesinum]|uniref:Uncharacterized protein n=1 Tax=Penicillium chermesinum TaxID=63820 RepID=A0A9W9TKC1_9EURO|nr:uncharacterized protein N7468_007206 [Penicillium chermesinum]KAJ5225981.1 hypothetical protein N7468_007206 [Penicillium chermesinum]